MKCLLVFVLLLPALGITLNAAESVWTQNTKVLSQKNSKAIIRAYKDNNQSNFEFTDDIEPPKTSDIEDNILVLGLSFGYGSITETLTNTRGSYDVDYSINSLKITFGKDFTLWHDEYTQPVRLYLTFSYNILSTDIDYTTITIGIKENMRYWPLYTSENYLIYPTLSYEIGSSHLTRSEHDISGVTSELAGGIGYERSNIEYTLDLSYSQTAWNHPIDGIKDESKGLQVHMNLNYRWMYDE